MMLILPYCAWAEGDESSYAATSVDGTEVSSEDSSYAEGDEPTAIGEEKVTESTLPGEVKSTSLTTPPPIAQPDQKMLSAQIQELTAELKSVKQELNQLKKPSSAPAAAPASGSVTSSGVPTGESSVAFVPVVNKSSDDLIGSMLPGQDDNDEAKTPEERAATEKARETAGPGNFIDGPISDEYNELKKLHDDIMLENGEIPQSKIVNFKSLCNRFTKKYEKHSRSRSAAFLLARIFMKNNDLELAQQSFALVYKDDEKGPHAADALLGLAEINAKNGNKGFAIKFLEKLKEDFDPNHLDEDKRKEFKRIAKLAGSSIALDKPSKPTLVVAKGPVKGVRSAPAGNRDTPKSKAATEVKKPVAAPKPAQQIQA